MIYSICGILRAKEANLAVVEASGIGYAVQTSNFSLSQMGETGTTVSLYTALVVKDGAPELFGFTTRQERDCFQLLITVSGVGTKAALTILSSITPDVFFRAVASNDTKALTKIKGIGAKTAARIVMDLKEKITSESFFSDAVSFSADAASASENVTDAIDALVALGYTRSDIAPILANLDATLPATELIRQALRKFSEQ